MLFRSCFASFCTLFLFCHCKNDAPLPEQHTDSSGENTALVEPAQPKQNEAVSLENRSDSIEKKEVSPAKKTPPPTDFVDIQTLDPSILLDIRYATDNNFTESKIYDCPRCLLRPKVAEAVLEIHKSLKVKGLGLKMFDCYRPAPYQQRLWDKVPDPRYVMHPKRGSQHSRGAAVDLTIVDSLGNELDMGTPYDFFGEEAHHPYTKLPKQVLVNRKLLKSTMEAAGFRSIRTEWWHYSLKGNSYPLSEELWPCD